MTRDSNEARLCVGSHTTEHTLIDSGPKEYEGEEKKNKWIYILIGCDIVRAYWLIEQQEHYPLSGMGWWPEAELWKLINLPVPNRC